MNELLRKFVVGSRSRIVIDKQFYSMQQRRGATAINGNLENQREFQIVVRQTGGILILKDTIAFDNVSFFQARRLKMWVANGQTLKNSDDVNLSLMLAAW